MTRRAESFDAIVVGGGLSGLSLASRMVEYLPGARLAVVDANFDGPDHKLWSWWDRADRICDLFPDVPRTVWRRMRVAMPGGERTEDLGPLAYATMRSDAFRTLQLGRLRAAGVHLVSDRVVGLVPGPDSATVTLPDRELVAPYVFQSMSLGPSERDRPVRYPLRQHFGGWVVRADSAPFDPSSFTLMDFDVAAVPGAVAFVYVLPFSENEALFEYTLFSPTPLPRSAYDAALTRLIDGRVQGRWEVIRTEYGVLPMEDRVPGPRWGERIFNVGAVGGAMKPSTGYAFARIQRQTEHLARTWAAGDPQPLPAAPRRFRLYDNLLLRVLFEEPEQAPAIFASLFRGNRFETVLRFLDEGTSLAEEARLFATLPWLPFLEGLRPQNVAAAWSHA
jgi:lycopene beta-cyclase